MTANEKNMKQNPLVIEKNATLKVAMEAISANQRGAAAVIDEKGKLIGILSDGDIRRALLREASLITPIEKIMNVNYMFYRKSMKETPDEIFKKNPQITILPVVDESHSLRDVLVPPQ